MVTAKTNQAIFRSKSSRGANLFILTTTSDIEANIVLISVTVLSHTLVFEHNYKANWLIYNLTNQIGYIT